MFNFLKDLFITLKFCLSALFTLGTVFVIICSIIFILIILPILYVNNYFERQAEWKQKINTCVMNPKARSDCKLILYKDRMNHLKKDDSFYPVFIPVIH